MIKHNSNFNYINSVHTIHLHRFHRFFPSHYQKLLNFQECVHSLNTQRVNKLQSINLLPLYEIQFYSQVKNNNFESIFHILVLIIPTFFPDQEVET